MKILLIDAYDSFVFIVKNYLENLNHDVCVLRCNAITSDDLLHADIVFLGPGPGHPTECGYIDIIERLEGVKPIFGICLGMQAIAEYYGIQVIPANSRQHGKVSQIHTTGEGIFSGLPSNFNVTRYHSLIADKSSFEGSQLKVTATSSLDNYVMALKHNKYPIEGVQFHPESITTEYGLDILKNFIHSAFNDIK